MAIPKKEIHQNVRLPKEGRIKIAIISDTHSNPHEDSVELVAGTSPDLILHAGDIGNRDVLIPFEEITTTVAVRGNIDSTSSDPDIATITISGDDYTLRIVMTHIALYGPRLRKDARLLAQKHSAHLLICGHSHVPFIGKQSGIVLFNPGSIGPPRPPLPISFGVMEFGPGHSSMRHVDCETGDTWLPPTM